MDSQHLSSAFSELSTPLIADACLRLGLPIRVAAPGIRSLPAGRAILPVESCLCDTMEVSMFSWKQWGWPNQEIFS